MHPTNTYYFSTIMNIKFKNFINMSHVYLNIFIIFVPKYEQVLLYIYIYINLQVLYSIFIYYIYDFIQHCLFMLHTLYIIILYHVSI